MEEIQDNQPVPEEVEKPTFYKIGEFAKMFGLSIQTIRNYQRKGILPERRNSVNKYRVFTDEDVATMAAIMKSETPSEE